jgi:hypothetical protein
MLNAQNVGVRLLVMEKAHLKLAGAYSSELAIVVGVLPLISGKAVRSDG